LHKAGTENTLYFNPSNAEGWVELITKSILVRVKEKGCIDHLEMRLALSSTLIFIHNEE